jgi:hypothetical protein
MRKIIFASLLLAGLAVQGQAQEKKFWIGGTVGYSSTKLPDIHDASETFTLLPEFGYNLSDRWAVGIRFGLNQADLNTDNTTTDFQEFSVAPFARYTLLNWKAFSIFADGGIGYSDYTGDMYANNGRLGDEHISEVGLFINPGFSLCLSNRFALIGRMNLFAVDYTQSSLGADGDKTKTFTANLNTPFNLDNFTLGFTFKF